MDNSFPGALAAAEEFRQLVLGCTSAEREPYYTIDRENRQVGAPFTFCYAREMARPILQLQATEEEVLELGRWARGTKVSVGDRFRARIIVLRLEGRRRPISISARIGACD